MTTAMTTTETNINERIFEVLAAGNIGILKPEERTAFYKATCESLGVNPLTRPFEYLVLNGKTVLYATRACADQLRKIHGISISEPRIEYQDDLVIVTVTGTDATGRTDSEIGAVPLGNLKGEARSNAIMKALTKSKRRLTLSMAGLGMLDETEVDSIPDSAKRPPVVMPQARVDRTTGEITDGGSSPSADLVTSPGQASAPASATAPVPPEPIGDYHAFWLATEEMGYSRASVVEFVGGGVTEGDIETWTQQDLNRCQVDLRKAKGQAALPV